MTRAPTFAAAALAAAVLSAHAARGPSISLKGPAVARHALGQIRSIQSALEGSTPELARTAARLEFALAGYDQAVADRLAAQGITTLDRLEEKIEALADAEFRLRHKLKPAQPVSETELLDLARLRGVAAAARAAHPYARAIEEEGAGAALRPTQAAGALQVAMTRVQDEGDALLSEFSSSDADDARWTRENLSRLESFLGANASYLDDEPRGVKSQLTRLYGPLSRRSVAAAHFHDDWLDSQLKAVAAGMPPEREALAASPGYAPLPDLSQKTFSDVTAVKKIRLWLKEIRAREKGRTPGDDAVPKIAQIAEAFADALLAETGPAPSEAAAENHRAGLLTKLAELSEIWDEAAGRFPQYDDEAYLLRKAVLRIYELRTSDFLKERREGGKPHKFPEIAKVERVEPLGLPLDPERKRLQDLDERIPIELPRIKDPRMIKSILRDVLQSQKDRLEQTASAANMRTLGHISSVLFELQADRFSREQIDAIRESLAQVLNHLRGEIAASPRLQDHEKSAISASLKMLWDAVPRLQAP